MSLAGLWQLPVVSSARITNTRWGRALPHPPYRMSLSVAPASPWRDRFKGDDVLEVRERISRAVERARTEHIPTLIEVETYRFRGHSISDPGNYRTRGRDRAVEKRDAVLIARPPGGRA